MPNESITSHNLLNLIFSLSFVFSQFFYFNVLIQQGLIPFATDLAISVPGPHIHEVLQNHALLSNQTAPQNNSSFDIVEKAFSWPVKGFGLLTGLGVVLTTFIFNFFDWVVMGVVFLITYVTMLFSPLLLTASVILMFLEGKPWMDNKKSLTAIVISFLLLTSLVLLITFVFHSTSNWRASLVFGAMFLFKDAGFYLNPVIYVTLIIALDYWMIKKLIQLTSLRKKIKE